MALEAEEVILSGFSGTTSGSLGIVGIVNRHTSRSYTHQKIDMTTPMNDEAPALAAYWPWRMAIGEDVHHRWDTVLADLLGQRALAIFLELPSDFEREIIEDIDFLLDIALERQRQSEKY